MDIHVSKHGGAKVELLGSDMDADNKVGERDQRTRADPVSLNVSAFRIKLLGLTGSFTGPTPAFAVPCWPSFGYKWVTGEDCGTERVGDRVLSVKNVERWYSRK